MGNCENMIDFLSGKNLIQGILFSINIDSDVKTLLDYLVLKIKNKKVIHFGVCDHIEIIEKKILSNRYIHKIVSEISDQCVGIDINEEAISFLREKYNVSNIIKLDILKDELPQEIYNKKWDYLLMLDVLEHVDNPVIFYQKFRESSKISSLKL